MALLADVLEWDVATWAPALLFWQREGGLDAAQLQCLDVGARSGGLSLWLAASGHRVVCSDVRDAERRARPLLERSSSIERVRFEDIDATSIPYEDRFDVVAFKSVLGGVGAGDRRDLQEAAIASMYRALKTGGRLLFAENLAGSPMHRALRSRFVRWGGSWRYVTIDEMRAFLRDFREVRFATTGFLAAFGRTETQRQMLAGIDRLALNDIVPPSWRYVIYGVATK